MLWITPNQHVLGRTEQTRLWRQTSLWVIISPAEKTLAQSHFNPVLPASLHSRPSHHQLNQFHTYISVWERVCYDQHETLRRGTFWCGSAVTADTYLIHHEAVKGWPNAACACHHNNISQELHTMCHISMFKCLKMIKAVLNPTFLRDVYALGEETWSNNKPVVDSRATEGSSADWRVQFHLVCWQMCMKRNVYIICHQPIM